MCVALQVAGWQSSISSPAPPPPSSTAPARPQPVTSHHLSASKDLSSSFVPHHHKSSHISMRLGVGSFSHTQISPGAKPQLSSRHRFINNSSKEIWYLQGSCEAFQNITSLPTMSAHSILTSSKRSCNCEDLCRLQERDQSLIWLSFC